MTTQSHRYIGKTVLAPMVKIGTLPTRILALRYGADLVYSEEIIDWKFLKSKRIVNDVTKTIDYIDETGSVFFQTCDEEKGKVILQIGTCDPQRALKVAQMTQDDISGIDINMGCPKEFSIKGGMGAALLTQPKKIEAILTTLVKNLKIPVTCKVRVLSTVEETLELCKLIESCGVAAIGIHGRTRYERPQHQNKNHYIKELAKNLNVPVIANGGSKEIQRYEDIAAFRKAAGSSSVMLARAAEWNPSIFSSDGLKSLEEVIPAFLRLAFEFDLSFQHVKYTIQMMLRDGQDTPLGKKFLATSVLSEVAKVFGLSEFYEWIQETRRKTSSTLPSAFVFVTSEDPLSENGHGPDAKKPRISDSSDNVTASEQLLVVPNCVFVRGHYAHDRFLPKQILLTFARRELSAVPVYETTEIGKRYQSTVNLGGQTFKTDVVEKSKRAAEQGAAMACLKYLNVPSS